jgi:hypothetical protein
MPTDETRHLLRAFGVAVTQYEDAVIGGAPAEELRDAHEEVIRRLTEIEALLDRLEAASK